MKNKKIRTSIIRTSIINKETNLITDEEPTSQKAYNKQTLSLLIQIQKRYPEDITKQPRR